MVLPTHLRALRGYLQSEHGDAEPLHRGDTFRATPSNCPPCQALNVGFPEIWMPAMCLYQSLMQPLEQ